MRSARQARNLRNWAIEQNNTSLYPPETRNRQRGTQRPAEVIILAELTRDFIIKNKCLSFNSNKSVIWRSSNENSNNARHLRLERKI